MWFPGLEGCIGIVSLLGTHEQDFVDFCVLGSDFVDFEICGRLRWGGYAPPDSPLSLGGFAPQTPP